MPRYITVAHSGVDSDADWEINDSLMQAERAGHVFKQDHRFVTIYELGPQIIKWVGQ